MTFVSSSLCPVAGSILVLWLNALNAYGCGSTLCSNLRPVEVGARRFAQLFHRRGAGARRGLIRRDDHPLDAVLAVHGPQRRDRDDRRAVRIGDDALVREDRVAIDLGNDERHAGIHAKRRRVVDDDRAGLHRGRRELLRRAAAQRRTSRCRRPRSSPRSAPARAASLPRNCIVLPAERADANSLSSFSGNLRRSRHSSSSTPTAPVAPTIATTGFTIFFAAICCSEKEEANSQNEKAPSGSGGASGSRACCSISARNSPKPS